MAEDVAESDRGIERNLRQDVLYRLVECQVTGFHQPKDRGGDERLGDAVDRETGVLIERERSVKIL